MKSSIKRILMAFSCVLALSMCANASVILSLASGSPTPSGSNFTWDYTVTLSGDQNFRSGDYTEIIDVGGFVSASWIPGVLSSVSITTQATGPGFPPSGGTDTALPNVVVTNTDGTISGNGSLQTLGTLEITSTSGSQAAAFTGSFSSQAQKVTDSTTTFNQGFLPVPSTPTSGVPEPATNMMLGGGLTALAFVMRKLRKN